MKWLLILISLWSGNVISQGAEVAVIGAGLAGLTAAYRLQEAGFDVEVYEARPRIGGRIFTVVVEDRLGELGALNIADGGDAENTLQLIEELGLKTVSFKVSHSLRSFWNGKELIPEEQLLKNHPFEAASLKLRLKELADSLPTMRKSMQADWV
jgi:monoamine oxidase